MYTAYDLKELLQDKIINSVEFNTDSDEGLIITTNEGYVLRIGFSSGYGEVLFNDEEINLWPVCGAKNI